MTFDVERVADTTCEVGEGPLWNEANGGLYWADIAHGDGYRYDPERGDYEHLWEGPDIGGFTLQIDGSLLTFGIAGRIRVRRGDDIETVVDEIPAERDGRFNDVPAGPDGQVSAGRSRPTATRSPLPGGVGRLPTRSSTTDSTSQTGWGSRRTGRRCTSPTPATSGTATTAGYTPTTTMRQRAPSRIDGSSSTPTTWRATRTE